MPISTSSFGDERDNRYSDYQSEEQYEVETMEFADITPAQAEAYLKRLGGGVNEKHKEVEGIGWKAAIESRDGGVAVTFSAHDELLDDLIRRFEEWVDRGL